MTAMTDRYIVPAGPVTCRHHVICLGGVIRGGFSQDTQGMISHTQMLYWVNQLKGNSEVSCFGFQILELSLNVGLFLIMRNCSEGGNVPQHEGMLESALI
ncbi:hypothetical protein GOODEAATRI_030975 [Goodea atripinnis]|uniref:Uncharacterized protein n=1 Tax=Goodea atripinnis TaxID=208336 RepID=A0ABV0MND7_9TELE